MKIRVATLAAVLLANLALGSCAKHDDQVLQGWVEAELVFVSPDEQGRIETEKVREGDRAQKGELLFTVDDDLQQADVMVKKTAVVNAEQNYDRAKTLLKTATGTQKNFDDAEAALRQAKANLDASQTRLNRRSVYSPVDGTVEQIYYRVGETVPPGRAVVALLPAIKYGEAVTVSCDGCDKALTAKVSFIARSAEYTPPVIYSLDERAKLVFLIEARPEHPEKFRVGQPVSVTLPRGAPP